MTRITRKIVLYTTVLIAWSMPSVADDADDAAKAEAARKATFQAGMEQIVADLNKTWFDTFVNSINRNDMVDRIYGLRLIDQKVKKSFNESLEYSWGQTITSQFGDTEDGLKATLLGVESRGNRGRAVVRFDLPKFQFNYHEYDLLLDEQGRMFILDWTDYLDGMRFSEGMGQYLVSAMPSKPALRKLLDFRNVSETELFQFGELLKASRDRKLDRYLEILGDLPEKFQRQRVIVETTVHLARGVRKRRAMLDGLKTMASYFPDEPLYALMLLDHYFPAKKYQEATEALLRAYRKIGFDDAAMEARLSAAALVMDNTQDALAYAERALELESDLELAWWSALNARATLEDYPACVEALKVLEEEFKYELDGKVLGRNPTYSGLVASSEFLAWRETR
jgi:tetratricopeptide (TPR) repeat protein